MLKSFLIFLSSPFLADEIHLDISKIKDIHLPKPKISTEKPSGFVSYISEESFSFESDAKKSCEEKVMIFNSYGVGIIGCNIFEKNNNYYFTIDYIPELNNPNQLNSVIINDYLANKHYWNSSLAKKDMEISFSRFKNSPLKPIEKMIIEIDGNYTFKIKYVVQNIIKRSHKYYVRIDKVRIGKYTFETEAKKDISKLINLFKQNGVAAIGGKIVEEDGYSIEIEYLNKTDENFTKYNNPEYSIDTYISQEVFAFEDEAMREGIKRNDVFEKASIPVLFNYSLTVENNWTFAFDYAVKNIYRNGKFVKKEHSIERYTSPQIFNFEDEARKVLYDKIRIFNNVGLYPVSYKIEECNDGYTFIIDYIKRN